MTNRVATATEASPTHPKRDDALGYWGTSDKPELAHLKEATDSIQGYAASARSEPPYAMFAVLLGITKCNPDWIKTMFLQPDEIDGDLPQDTLPVIYYKTDQSHYFAAKKGEAPELAQLGGYEQDRSFEVADAWWVYSQGFVLMGRWPWALAEAAVRGGWTPETTDGGINMDTKAADALRAITGLETESIKVDEGTDLWDKYLQHADVTPIYIQVYTEKHGIQPEEWHPVIRITGEGDERQIHFGSYNAVNDILGFTEKLSELTITHLVWLTPGENNLPVAFAGDVVRKKLQTKVKVGDLEQ